MAGRTSALLFVALLGAASLRAQTTVPGPAAPAEGASLARAKSGDTVPGGALARALERLAGGERDLAAGRADAAVAAFGRAAAELGRVVVQGRAEREAWRAAVRRAAAGAAAAYLAIGDTYLARLEARRALDLDPRDPPLQVLLGTSSYREGRFADARTAFDEALRLDPSFGAAHRGRGLVDLGANRLASARERFLRAHALDGDPASLLALARLALLERDYEHAARRLGEYLERDSRLDRARREELREAARVYARLGGGRGSRLPAELTAARLRFEVAPGDEVPLLAARINGQGPVYLIFDTGAEDHVLDAGYARELGLELSDRAGRLESGLGSAERRLAVLDSLDLGGLVAESVPVSVADLGELGLDGGRGYAVAGVLSPALLLRDFLLRLDFRQRTIELRRYDAGGREYLEREPAPRRLAVPFHFDADGTGMIVDADLGGSPGHPLLVDTGASDVYLSTLTGRVLGLDPLDVRIGLGGHYRAGLRVHFLREPLGRAEHALPARGVGGERSGGHEAAGQEGGYQGLAHEGAAYEGVAYEGILGYAFFRDLRVVLDYYHTLLLIER